MISLRTYQQDGLDALRTSISLGKKRPMLQAATGAGKTRIAAAIFESALSKGNRCIFTVPAIDLIDQTHESFTDLGITNIGVIQSDHPLTDYSQPIQIASVQTLANRNIPKSQVCIIDEAHRWFKFYEQWMNDDQWSKIPFIGLSATPWSTGLGKHYDDLIVVATAQQLIETGYLTPAKFYAPSHPDLSGVKTVAGDYDESQISEIMQDKKLVGDVVRNWIENAEGRPTFCFCVDRTHAAKVQKEFLKAGIPAGYIDCFTSRSERKKIRDMFHSGELKVICNVGVLTTGIDWDVRCIILARPTKSEILFVQIIGRGLRLAEGKFDCLVFDHTDTTLRLGIAASIHHDILCTGKPKSKLERAQEIVERLPRECPMCTYLIERGTLVCPSCGFKAEKISDIKPGPGELELVEIIGKDKNKKKVYTMQEKQDWYSGFIWIANHRGKSPKYALALYKNKFGVWPNRLQECSKPPTQEMFNYVKSRNIAFAKRKKAA